MRTDIPNFVQALYQAQERSKVAADLKDRIYGQKLAVVTENNDPTGQRRIKVSFPNNPGLDSQWIRRKQAHPGIDPPVPSIGSTVLVSFVEGKESLGYYEQAVNKTNPPIKTEDELNDYSLTVPGSKIETVTKNLKVSVGEEVLIETEIGGSFKIDGTTGVVTIVSPVEIRLEAPQVTFATPTISFGSSGSPIGSGTFYIDNLDFLVNDDLTINGNSVATVGAVDSDSDVLTTRGW